MKIRFRHQLIIALCFFASSSFAKDECAELLAAQQLTTIDDVLSLVRPYGKISDCGPGCYEYSDPSFESVSEDQLENERRAATAYAETLLAKDEGFLLLSRFRGLDVPAYDGLVFKLSTGSIVARASIKAGVKTTEMLDHALLRIYQYSSKGGGKWGELAGAKIRALNRSFDAEPMRAEITETYNQIGAIFMVNGSLIKSRIVMNCVKRGSLNEDLVQYARKRFSSFNVDALESVVFLNGGNVRTLRP